MTITRGKKPTKRPEIEIMISFELKITKTQSPLLSNRVRNNQHILLGTCGTDVQ